MSRVVTYLDGSTGEVRKVELSNDMADAVLGLDKSWAYKKDDDSRLCGIRHLPKAQQYLYTEGQVVSAGHLTDKQALANCNVGPYHNGGCGQHYKSYGNL